MNDLFVGDNCDIAIHCRGHVFTVSELFNIAQNRTHPFTHKFIRKVRRHYLINYVV